ncbi:rCG24036, isoform CRA_e [Rattus norvegicus]|uniref:RCG24036, isoform CRA_e n=1 Tax=Rattus norvegicus TaxID=10116 RepID=A6JWE7_RAT|nr:rCG24036, isoform CRA_e [Rattus norvegicus]
MQELEAKHPLQWVAPERTDKERRTTRPTKEDRNEGNTTKLTTKKEKEKGKCPVCDLPPWCLRPTPTSC